MKFLLLSILFSLNVGAAPEAASGYDSLLNNQKLLLAKPDLVLAENLVSMIRFTEKGYINQDVLTKVLGEAEKSKHFALFAPWLRSIQQISKLATTQELTTFCSVYAERKETLPLERMLERLAGNYCRERALESIGRDIDKDGLLTDESSNFIQRNFKFFLTKKNKKNFAFFLQSQANRPEIMKKLSHEVTTYSVLHEIVPSQDVLKDILINEQITKLIQDKGFNPIQQKNVFYAEYGKMIETGYKVIDAKTGEEKLKEHFKFLRNYLDLNKDHLPVGLCLTRMNDFAKSVFRAGHKALSQDIFKYIVKKNNKEIHEDAQFFYLWTHLYSNEFKEALKLAKDLGLLKSGAPIQDPRLRFWIAFAYEHTDQVKSAIPYYEHIITNSPLSYYGIMSAKKLQVHKPDSEAVTFYLTNSMRAAQPITIDLAKLEEDHLSSLIRLKAWAKLDSQKMLKLELRRLKNHSMPAFLEKSPSAELLSLRSDLHLINAYIIQNSENHLATFRYLYDVLDKKEVIFNRSLLEVLYPRPYLDFLNKTLKNATLDPIVVLSLIRQESVFNPLARSPVGARGLMQLMPMTARRMKNSIRDKHLVNPHINIELGTKYFSNLLKRYDGNLVYVLAAYNAGESRV